MSIADAYEWMSEFETLTKGRQGSLCLFLLYSFYSVVHQPNYWYRDHSQPGVEQYVAQFVEDHRTQDHNDASDIDNGKGKTSKQKKLKKSENGIIYLTPLPPTERVENKRMKYF